MAFESFVLTLHRKFMDHAEMRNAILFACLMFTMVSCIKKTSVAMYDTPYEAEDTIVTITTPTADIDEPSSDVPITADEVFSDFFYSFTNNKTYKISRIVFPLPCISGQKTTYIDKDKWHFTRLQGKESIYVVFYDKRSSTELEKSSNLTEVKVERFKMEDELVCIYDFKKIEGKWMLSELKYQSLEYYKDCDFVQFYQLFASDSIFQSEHLKSSLTISVVDPEEDEEEMNGTIDAQQWPYFRPDMPKNDFINIDYGQSIRINDHRIVALEGISNSYLCLLYFVNEDGRWMLYRLDD